MDGARVLRAVRDGAAVGPRAVDRLRRGIRPEFRASAGSVFEIVGAVQLVYPRRLLEVGVLLSVAAVACAPLLPQRRAERGFVHEARHRLHLAGELVHVLLELYVPAAGVSAAVAPEEPGLAVVVYEYGRVDVADWGAQKRVANGIGPGTFHRVGSGHADRVAALSVLHRHVPMPFAVALDRLRGPGAVALARPLERGGVHHRAVAMPVDHVLRREHLPVLHLVPARVGFVVPCEYIERITVHHRGGIGRETVLDDRIRAVRRLKRRSQRLGRAECRHCGTQSEYGLPRQPDHLDSIWFFHGREYIINWHLSASLTLHLRFSLNLRFAIHNLD